MKKGKIFIILFIAFFVFSGINCVRFESVSIDPYIIRYLTHSSDGGGIGQYGDKLKIIPTIGRYIYLPTFYKVRTFTINVIFTEYSGDIGFLTYTSETNSIQIIFCFNNNTLKIKYVYGSTISVVSYNYEYSDKEISISFEGQYVKFDTLKRYIWWFDPMDFDESNLFFGSISGTYVVLLTDYSVDSAIISPYSTENFYTFESYLFPEKGKQIGFPIFQDYYHSDYQMAIILPESGIIIHLFANYFDGHHYFRYKIVQKESVLKDTGSIDIEYSSVNFNMRLYLKIDDDGFKIWFYSSTTGNTYAKHTFSALTIKDTNVFYGEYWNSQHDPKPERVVLENTGTGDWFGWIIGALKSIMNTFSSFLRGLINGIINILNSVYNFLNTIYQKIVDIYNIIVNFLDKSLSSIYNIINSVYNGIQNILNSISWFFNDFIEKYITPITDFVQKIVDFILSISPQDIYNFLVKLWGWFFDTIFLIFDAIFYIIDNFGDFINFVMILFQLIVTGFTLIKVYSGLFIFGFIMWLTSPLLVGSTDLFFERLLKTYQIIYNIVMSIINLIIRIAHFLRDLIPVI